ncbi:MAG: hypothetical protein LQ337_008367 [Flavoplaca oasis]|nr:MAG: hypothetical protein LQ337_008367 [Flavoplaca oasis]
MSSSNSTKSPPKSKGRSQAGAEQYSLSATVSEPAAETEPRLFTIRIKSPITPEGRTMYEEAAHLILQSFHWDQLFENYGPGKGPRFKRDVLIPLLVPLYGSRSRQKEVMRQEEAQDNVHHAQLDAIEWQESEVEHKIVLDELYTERGDLEKMYDELKGLKDWKQCSKYKDLESRIERENKDFAQRKAERGGCGVESLRG